jgi:hypothetical protein
VDAHLVALQDEQAFRWIRTLTVQILTLTGRVEMVLLRFDASFELVLAVVVIHVEQRQKNDGDYGNRQEEDTSIHRALISVNITLKLASGESGIADGERTRLAGRTGNQDHVVASA